MPTFHHYRPGFIDVEENQSNIEFQTFEELLTHDIFVQKTINNPGFYRFEFNSNSKTVMSVYDDGYEWYVIGFVDQVLTGLPEFAPKYREAKGHARPMGAILKVEELRLKATELVGSICTACGQGTMYISDLSDFTVECDTCGATIGE